MANRSTLIERLNTVLSWELAGIIQNLNHSMMITGKSRLEFQEFFADNSKENRDHAEEVGNRIAALGGVPTVEPAAVTQAADLDSMLEAALKLEEAAFEAWNAALEEADAAGPGVRFWIEDMISEEQEHIDELRKLTGKVSFSAEQIAGEEAAG